MAVVTSNSQDQSNVIDQLNSDASKITKKQQTPEVLAAQQSALGLQSNNTGSNQQKIGSTPQPTTPYVQEGQLLPNVAKPKVVQPTINPVSSERLVPTDPEAQRIQNENMKAKPQQATGSLQDQNTQVKTAANQSALNGQNANNDTMTLVQQKTRDLINNPLLYDKEKYIQSQVEAGDRNRASAMLAAQQGIADTANTGVSRDKMYNYAMGSAQERGTQENTLRMEQAQKEQDAMLKALVQGGTTATTQNTLDTEAFDRLVKASNMYEPERAQGTVTADTAATIQGNKDLSAQGFGQDVQKLAIENGYDLNKLEKTYGYEATKAAVEHGYNLDILAKTYGNDIAKMGIAQGYDLDKLTATYGLEATKAAVQQGYDLDKMSVAFGNDTAKLTLASNLDTASKSALMNLQDKIDTKTLLTENDFKKTEAELDRQLATFKATGDWQNATNIENLKGQIAKQSQDAQNVFTQQMAETNHAWQTTDKLDSQVFDRATQTLAIAAEKAKQDNDIEAQKYLASEKSKLDLKMQTNDMTHDETMAYLTAKYDEAKAANNQSRQKEILDMQTMAALNLADRNGTIDEAKITLQGDINKALADKDYTKATTLQDNQIAFDQKKLDQDTIISNAEILLKQRGFTSEQIQAAVEAGAADPKSLTDFLTKAGISTTPPDPMAEQKAMKQKADLMLYQFGLTHPDSTVYTVPGVATPLTKTEVDNLKASGQLTKTQAAAITSSVSPAMIKQYNDFVNQTMYNEKIGQSSASKIAQANPADLQGADQEGHPMHQDYVNALKVATPFNNAVTREGGSGLGQDHTDKFKNPIPSVGVSFKGSDGKLYVATAGIATDSSDGNKTEYFYALDPATGNTMKVSAANGGTYTTWQKALKDSLTYNPVTDPMGVGLSNAALKDTGNGGI